MFGFLLFLLFFSGVSFLFFSQRKWWIRVSTQVPHCVYYFGPFDSQQEAIDHHQGFLADLEMEGAQGIDYKIERGSPRQLTVGED
ncbi:MAG: hypothetical protein RLZZ568_25 [Cyanobacteriota bacterium]|jgi:hypothetical protein